MVVQDRLVVRQLKSGAGALRLAGDAAVAVEGGGASLHLKPNTELRASGGLQVATMVTIRNQLQCMR